MSVASGSTGNKTTGVEVERNGSRRLVNAGSEVILSAGAYHSPQILMVSGVGPPAILNRMASRSSRRSTESGSNLQDHFGSFVQHRCKEPITYYNMRQPLKLAGAAIRYVLTGGGPLSVFPMNVMAFIKSDAALERPDIQFYLVPSAVNPAKVGGSLASFPWLQFALVPPQARIPRPPRIGVARPSASAPHLSQLSWKRARQIAQSNRFSHRAGASCTVGI